MFKFSPKNDKFYDLFIELTSVIEEASTELTLLSRNAKDAEEINSKLKTIEHKGYKKIFKSSNSISCIFSL